MFIIPNMYHENALSFIIHVLNMTFKIIYIMCEWLIYILKIVNFNYSYNCICLLLESAQVGIMCKKHIDPSLHIPFIYLYHIQQPMTIKIEKAKNKWKLRKMKKKEEEPREKEMKPKVGKGASEYKFDMHLFIINIK